MDEAKETGRTFGVDLWDGFPKVHSYLHDGRVEMKRLQAFFQERAFAEATYAKQLQKCCENLLSEKFTFSGTTGTAIMRLENCNRLAITKHSELSKRLHTHADTALGTFVKQSKEEGNKMRKSHDKVTDQVASKDSQMKKAQKTYHSNNETCINQVSARNALMANNAPQPKLDKAEKKLKQAASKLANSEKSYKESVDNLKRQQLARDGTVRNLLEESEKLARHRMAEIQGSLRLWKDIFDDLAAHINDLSSQLDGAINSIDINKDVQDFIARSYSGQDIKNSHVVYQPLQKVNMSCFADQFSKSASPTNHTPPSSAAAAAAASASTPVAASTGGSSISGPMNTGGGVGSSSTPSGPRSISAANTSGGRSESSTSHSGPVEQKSSVQTMAPNANGTSPAVAAATGVGGPNRSTTPLGANNNSSTGTPLNGSMTNNTHTPRPPTAAGGGGRGAGSPMRGGRMSVGGRGGGPVGGMPARMSGPQAEAMGVGVGGGGPAADAADGGMPPSDAAPQPPVSGVRQFVRALYDTTVEEEGQPGSNGTADNEMQPNELRFVAGDIILFHEDLGNGWWRGETRDGNEGIMPANYVEMIESPNNPNPTWDDIMRIAQRFCRAIFAFQGNRDDGELSFDIGEDIEIISEIEEWYNGRTKDGSTGLFPQTYVNLISNEERQQ